MKNRFYLLVNGILSSPGDVKAWTDRAESWIEDKTRFNAGRFEYFSGALTRRLYQNSRVEKMSSIISRISSDSIYLVGHSNGCDLIERFVRKTSRRIEEIHLVAAASEKDFRKNGFNKALLSNQIGKIFIYRSHGDRALKLANWTQPFISWLGLGYGSLGYTGAKNVNGLVKSRVIEVEFGFDHTDYFSDVQFELTMRTIVGAHHD